MEQIKKKILPAVIPRFAVLFFSLRWVLLPSKKKKGGGGSKYWSDGLSPGQKKEGKKATHCFCKHVFQTLTKEPDKEFRTVFLQLNRHHRALMQMVHACKHVQKSSFPFLRIQPDTTITPKPILAQKRSQFSLASSRIAIEKAKANPTSAPSSRRHDCDNDIIR